MLEDMKVLPFGGFIRRGEEVLLTSPVRPPTSPLDFCPFTQRGGTPVASLELGTTDSLL